MLKRKTLQIKKIYPLDHPSPSPHYSWVHAHPKQPSPPPTYFNDLLTGLACNIGHRSLTANHLGLCVCGGWGKGVYRARNRGPPMCNWVGSPSLPPPLPHTKTLAGICFATCTVPPTPTHTYITVTIIQRAGKSRKEERARSKSTRDGR